MKNCLNCHTPLEETDHYCPKCGQKDQRTIVPLAVIIGDNFANIFNLDSRFFKTVGKLFIPGALTLEWFQGRRVQYFSPFRVQLISLLILLAYVNLVYPDFTNIGDVFNSREAHHHIAIDSLKVRYQEKRSEMNLAFPDIAPEEMARLKDSILDGGVDSIGIDMHFTIFKDFTFRVGNGEDSAKTDIAVADIVYKPLDEIGSDMADSTEWLNITLMRQFVKLLRSPTDFLAALISNVVWMVIFMLPMVALLLLLLYWRQGYFFVQHLVFLYHVSSFQVIALTLGIMISTVTSEISIGISILAGLIYHFIAYKRVYKDSLFKGLVKYSLFGFWEMLVAFMALLVYLLVSMATF